MTLTLNSEIAAVLAPMAAEMASVTRPAVGDVATRRAVSEPMISHANAPGTPDDVTITRFHTTSADGATVELRWYTNNCASPGPAGLYLHGGGMIRGNLDMFDAPVARYTSASGVPMLAVEYRLAPEHPYPAAVEDSYAGLRWLADHASELGVDTARVAVMGDSAGGGLAAATALLARDRGGPQVAPQVLLFAMLDDRTTTRDPEVAPFAFWTYDDNITGWNALLGDTAGGPDVSPYAAPARLADAHGLPPAYLEIGQLDIFRDENLAYALLLSRAGVDVEFHLHPGVPHEYDGLAPEADISKRAMADRLRVLRQL